MSNAPSEYIELRQRRDFSEVISTGFQFIRANWKTLYRPLVFVALPLYVVALLLFRYFQSMVRMDPGLGFGGMLLSYVLLFISVMLMHAIVFEYMRFYMLNKRLAPAAGELWREVRKQLLIYIAIGMLAGLIAVFGMVFCLVPGIWLAVVFLAALPLHAFERADVGDCISRSFKVIKGHWWMTFGLAFMLCILIIVISGIIYLPFLLIGGFGALSGLFGMNNLASAGAGLSWMAIIFTVTRGAAGVLLQPFLQVPISLQILSLIEEKEGRGLMERVDAVIVPPPTA